MVKTRVGKHAEIFNSKMGDGMKIFGRTGIEGSSFTLRVTTRTLDNFGQLSALSNVDTSFYGDLQTGVDLDQRYVTTGIIEVGDGVLFVNSNALTTLPLPGNVVIDSDNNGEWEIIGRISNPELEGTRTVYEYRCKRKIVSNDS